MIEPPTNCPSCNSILSWSKDQIYCLNPNCSAKSAKQVEHFAKTLKIKGLGPAAIDKIGLTSIQEIYELDLEYISMQLNSKALAVKLFEEIQKSKNEPLNTVLPAFGITLVGKSATDKLSQVCESIFDVDEATCKAAGLGNVATDNLLTWIEECFDSFCHLPFSFEFEKSAVSSANVIVCISGKLNSFKTKAEAAKALEDRGIKVKDSLTKDVTILVNESGVESAKTVKAEQFGVQIVTNLKEYLENN